MNILDLAESIGLKAFRVASTNGGEYKSSCPNCGGQDRFCIWPNSNVTGRYWCRQCNKNGDCIQFCRDFLGMNYVDACKKLHKEPRQYNKINGHYPFKQSSFIPKDNQQPSNKWQERAALFVKSCHAKLMTNSLALKSLFDRGFTKKSIEEYSFGWNPRTLFENRSVWGLSPMLQDNKKAKLQWLPQGILIPSIIDNKVVKLKIRRSEWNENDKLPKYVEVVGSMNSPAIYGSVASPIVIVESEFDALLIKQFADDICTPIALGGASKRPDKMLHDLLLRSPIILLSLDHDLAGIKEYQFWMNLYPNLLSWPARQGKSPGDSYSKHGIDLNKWIKDGLQYSGDYLIR